VTASKTVLTVVALALLQLAVLPTSHAVNISNGERIYGSICYACHSRRVTNNVYGILAAANDPDLIRRTIATNPPMEFLGSTLSAAEIEDVAAYLGNHDGIDPDRIFDWAAWKYGVLFRPAETSSQVAAGYYFRHYTESNNYVGIRQGRVYYYAPGMAAPLDVGDAVYVLEQATADHF
jgi:cytochrome c553